jgi:3-oxoacyl-[acyl-carrier protein] reductase
MDLRLDGERALVLASSKGLGRASATELAREGARVAISSSSRENLDAAKSAIVEEAGVSDDRVVPVVIDLTDEDGIVDGVEEAIDALGGLDVLVTNRGGPPEQNFEESSVQDFKDVVGSVLMSSIIAIKTAMPTLRDGGGAITNITATSVKEPQSNHVLANTARPGLYGLSKTLANEYGDEGVRVNCVTPRGVETDRGKGRRERFGTLGEDITREEAKEQGILRLIGGGQDPALDRRADPEEFGRVVAFVSSDAASYVTGSVVDVDGGWSRHVF